MNIRLKRSSLIWGSVLFHIIRGSVKQWAQLHTILCNQSRIGQLCKFAFLFASLYSDKLRKFCVPTHRYWKKSNILKLVVLSAVLHYSFGFWIITSNLNLWASHFSVMERKIGKSVPNKWLIFDSWRIEMGQKKKHVTSKGWKKLRRPIMKTGLEAMRKREMEVYKVSSVFSLLQTSLPVPVAAWSKAWVCWDCGF